MATTIISIILRLLAIAVFMLISDQLIALVPSDPGAAVRSLCVLLMITVILTGIWKVARPRHSYAGSAIAGSAALSPARLGTLEDETDYQLERRARHEAAHAVVALHHGKPMIRADVIRNHRVGGTVSYGSVNGNLADIAFQNMQISFAGQIVDIAGKYFDGGSQDDMRHITDHAMMILSTGERPEGFTGSITAERLVRSARAATVTILGKHEAEIERITAALVERRVLNHADLTALMAPPEQADSEAAA